MIPGYVFLTIYTMYTLTYIYISIYTYLLYIGDVHKKKEIVQDVTLNDLDMANARPQGKKCLETLREKYSM